MVGYPAGRRGERPQVYNRPIPKEKEGGSEHDLRRDRQAFTGPVPGSNEDVFNVVSESMPKIPDLEKKHNVKNLGTHIMLGSHKQVMILDGPSFEAAEGCSSNLGF